MIISNKKRLYAPKPARYPDYDETFTGGMEMNSVCVFCGSSRGENPRFLEVACDVGGVLARRGITLIYGGAGVGMMGMTAKACLENGGRVTGVIPERLVEMEVAHRGLTELIVVRSMHERKARMNELCDGFIVLPGGIGTLEETFEVLTWRQLGIHEKPVGILNIDGFFDALLAFLDRTVNDGFLRKEHRDMLIVDTGPMALLDRMEAHRPARIEKWFNVDTHRI